MGVEHQWWAVVTFQRCLTSRRQHRGPHPGVPHLGVTALAAQRRQCVVDRADVAAVPVDQQQGRPVQRGVPAQLDQQGRQGGPPDREGAGEVRVLAAGADGNGRPEPDAVPAGAGPLGHGDGDAGIGVQRQVRPVLLE
jgi:hypothetical protein